MRVATSRPAAPETRDAVASLRRETQELFAGLGGISWQVARDYPFRNQLHDGSWELLARLKAAIDPANRVNPGVLGFERPRGRVLQREHDLEHRRLVQPPRRRHPECLNWAPRACAS